ncbi:MAG: tetratricopeptide repeat protein [Deltaproteobacteria bacterium]|nr:tetratricopeptide repeat protein [Deltaproteobacteria bacterium]
MTIEWAEWWPPLVVMAVGVIAGLVYALRTHSSEDELQEAALSGRRADLERERDATVEALHTLELEKGKLDAEEYTRQRQELIAKGAGALRELDEGPEATPTVVPEGGTDTVPGADAAARQSLEAQRAQLGDAAVDAALAALDGKAAPPPAPKVSPAWQGALWALLAVILVAVLVWWAQGNTVARRDDAPMTGGPSATAPAEHQQMFTEMEAQLAADPNDIEALNTLAAMAIEQQDLAAAMTYNTRARQVDPENADARVHFAFLRIAIGQREQAMAELDAVLAVNPHHLGALVYKGSLAMMMGKPEVAVQALESAVASGAAGDPTVEGELARARAMLAAPGDVPPGESPVEPSPHEAVLAPAGHDTVLAGTVTLDPGVASRLSGQEVLWVSVHDPAGGPPLAAVRLPAGPFPLAFRVTPANAIAMGGAPHTFPDTLDLHVRIDLDGDLQTRADNEPLYHGNGLAKGTTDVLAELR